MERVSFLVEENNERISCMLNPETVVMRRTAGVRSRETLNGLINATGSGDNPLLFTGSGNTTLELDLLFDISILGSSIETQDVRDLTKPIWDLSENNQRNDRLFRPAICRFIWGKYWNFPGVISAIAERLEYFSPQGIPRRSWLRLRLLRMQLQPQSPHYENELWEPMNQVSNTFAGDLGMPGKELSEPYPEQADFMNTEIGMQESITTRIDLSAHCIMGDSTRWRDVAKTFNVLNPLQWLETLSPQQNNSSENPESSNE